MDSTMKRTLFAIAMLIGALAAPAGAAWPGDPAAKCRPDAVKAGSVCIDKYEASIWEVPATNAEGKSNEALIRKIQKGIVTLEALQAGGATLISPSSGCVPAFPSTFPTNGQWSAPLYAVSIPGVRPTACVSWLQAQQACGLSGKRLPSNAEWQLAVAGTPDPGPDNGSSDCNVASVLDAVETGSRSACVSNWGAHDMVGNVWEIVADWVPRSTTCTTWPSWVPTTDYQCFAGAATTDDPGVLVRGGYYYDDGYAGGTAAGPLAITGTNGPGTTNVRIGFRCAR